MNLYALSGVYFRQDSDSILHGEGAGSPLVCDLRISVMAITSSTFGSLFVSAMAGIDNSAIITIDAVILFIFIF
jgi:hypothetical protein